MVNEKFIHLLSPPPVSKWAKAARVLLWSLYCLVAFMVSYFLLITGNLPMFAFAVTAFIFGPKLWRRIH